MTRNILFALIGGFVIGAIVGYFLGAGSRSGSSMVVAAGVPASQAPAATATPVMPGAFPESMTGSLAAPPSAEMQKNIAALERTVLQEPGNHQAWVGLGNGYFDSHQPQKAVTAYAKALSLQGNDPNVLTDQGVMFRALGQFDKALANFQKANKLDPKHLQSLFNQGIVYANDLHKPAEATAVWNKLIALAPASQQAEQARQALANLKSQLIH